MLTDTKSRLIHDATTLVRQRGYAGFSYADLAEAVGVRKPSIHHHFPLKEDLGAAIVEAYSEQFSERLADIWASSDKAIERLSAYAQPYRDGVQTGQGCLCGVLASELLGLPPKVQTAVKRFFIMNLDWLERVLRDAWPALHGGRKGASRRQAETVLSTFQGASLLALALGTPKAFDDAVEELLVALHPKITRS
jgi:TetR/AcrR family transcriptional regulator, transcriptional repressor for nem operon